MSLCEAVHVRISFISCRCYQSYLVRKGTKREIICHVLTGNKPGTRDIGRADSRCIYDVYLLEYIFMVHNTRQHRPRCGIRVITKIYQRKYQYVFAIFIMIVQVNYHRIKSIYEKTPNCVTCEILHNEHVPRMVIREAVRRIRSYRSHTSRLLHGFIQVYSYTHTYE